MLGKVGQVRLAWFNACKAGMAGVATTLTPGLTASLL